MPHARGHRSTLGSPPWSRSEIRVYVNWPRTAMCEPWRTCHAAIQLLSLLCCTPQRARPARCDAQRVLRGMWLSFRQSQHWWLPRSSGTGTWWYLAHDRSWPPNFKSFYGLITGQPAGSCGAARGCAVEVSSHPCWGRRRGLQTAGNLSTARVLYAYLYR